AEYAPEAVQAIKQAPVEQTAQSGTAEGAAGVAGGDNGAGATTTTSTTLAPAAGPQNQGPVIETARVKRCIGDPPRQIEDPQSPPCVPYFDGDNGGATSPGVTANEIRIAAPSKDGNVFNTLLTFFNQRFQFYGRQLKLVDGGCFDSDPKTAKSLADKVATENTFGSLSFCDSMGTDYYYYDELARHQ